MSIKVYWWDTNLDDKKIMSFSVFNKVTTKFVDQGDLCIYNENDDLIGTFPNGNWHHWEIINK